jgi:hypothetical protein
VGLPLLVATQRSLLDGYSRYIIHWELRESMTEADVETILQRAHELFPTVRPRIISDNGPQFLARDFKAFIRLCWMTPVRTSPFAHRATARSEAGTRRSNESASGRKHRSTWQTPAALLGARSVSTLMPTQRDQLRNAPEPPGGGMLSPYGQSAIGDCLRPDVCDERHARRTSCGSTPCIRERGRSSTTLHGMRQNSILR